MANEGESYLDELLNTVAPDWEETSLSPEDMLADFDENAEGEMSLEEALAVLDDLPDSEEELYEDMDEENTFEDLGGLGDILGLDPDSPPDPAGEKPAENPTVQETPSAESGDAKELPVMETEEADEGNGEDVAPAEPAQEETPDTAEDAELPSEEEPDIPVDFEAVMPEEESEPQRDEAAETEPAVKDTVDVDDIFQDALSAVGYSGNEDDGDLSFDGLGEYVDGSGEVSTIPAVDPMSGEKKKKGKKEKAGPGLASRIFGNIITDETAEEEEKERQAEEAERAKKAKKKEEKKKQDEVSKEEKAQLAQEEKERKKQLKAEKAAQKAEEKEEKKRLKAERKAEEEAHEVVGKINPVGAAIVVIFFATIGILTVFGSMLLSRNSSLDQAENLFASGDYMKAYDTIHAASMVDTEDELYKRIRLCSQVQKEVNSYQNYTAMGLKLEALDSLVKGVRHYDLNLAEAAVLGIAGQMETLKGQLLGALGSDFGLSEDEARELIGIENRTEYAERLREILQRIQAV